MNFIAFARIICGIICVIGLGALVVGAMHLHDCAFDTMIPIWLLVYGVLTTVRLPCIVPHVIGIRTPEAFQNLSCFTFFLFSVFDLGWLIYGCVLVFGKSPNTSIKGAPSYCDRTTFEFTQITIGLFWILNLIGCCINYHEAKTRTIFRKDSPIKANGTDIKVQP